MPKTAYRDLVRFRSGLPEHVLQAMIDVEALWISAPTDFDDCEYCVAIMDGERPCPLGQVSIVPCMKKSTKNSVD
jgi:hypothetical protein